MGSYLFIYYGEILRRPTEMNSSYLIDLRFNKNRKTVNLFEEKENNYFLDFSCLFSKKERFYGNNKTNRYSG